MVTVHQDLTNLTFNCLLSALIVMLLLISSKPAEFTAMNAGEQPFVSVRFSSIFT